MIVSLTLAIGVFTYDAYKVFFPDEPRIKTAEKLLNQIQFLRGS